MRIVGRIGTIGTSEMSTQNKSNGHITLAVLSFIALIGLTITLITYKSDDIIIKFILIILPIILIIGFWGESIYKKIKNNLKQRKLDKLSKVHFISFKKLVLRFEKFVGFYDHNLLFVIKHIKENTNEFSQINITEQRIIENWYQGYKKHLNQFDGTINGLFWLNDVFDNMLFNYELIYINKPIKEMNKIGIDKLQLSDKKSYKIAQEEYFDFIKDCKKFTENANEDFKGNIELDRKNFQIIEDL